MKISICVNYIFKEYIQWLKVWSQNGKEQPSVILLIIDRDLLLVQLQ